MERQALSSCLPKNQLGNPTYPWILGSSPQVAAGLAGSSVDSGQRIPASGNLGWNQLMGRENPKHNSQLLANPLLFPLSPFSDSSLSYFLSTSTPVDPLSFSYLIR